MSKLDGILSQIIKTLPENERGSVSIERCAEIARTTALRYANERHFDEMEKNSTKAKDSDTDKASSFAQEMF
jgi:hypothetical protein